MTQKTRSEIEADPRVATAKNLFAAEHLRKPLGEGHARYEIRYALTKAVAEDDSGHLTEVVNRLVRPAFRPAVLDWLQRLARSAGMKDPDERTWRVGEVLGPAGPALTDEPVNLDCPECGYEGPHPNTVDEDGERVAECQECYVRFTVVAAD